MAFLFISGPLFIIGILYWLNWIKRDELRPESTEKIKKNHHDREDMTGEHKFGDAGQAGFAILFFIVWISDTFYFRYTTFLNDLVPNIIRAPIGIILLIISGYLAKTTLSQVFGEVREIPCVIRTGFYKYSRHPMYFSEVLLYLGMLIISISLAATVIWILAIIFLYYLCRHEEKLLLDRFGSDYRKYMQEVPMWLPRFRKINDPD
ncbi:MAG: isoprenylcysteine carboxylmethyltransferase family protein [Candidatus Marinimicrobia bacterium]|nr:isoprenylcysteine carboxylmethyltransferase family protein [Candidatus Neomarinimicrobiota bacterium]